MPIRALPRRVVAKLEVSRATGIRRRRRVRADGLIAARAMVTTTPARVAAGFEAELTPATRPALPLAWRGEAQRGHPTLLIALVGRTTATSGAFRPP